MTPCGWPGTGMWGGGGDREGVSHGCTSSQGKFDGRERQGRGQERRVMGKMDCFPRLQHRGGSYREVATLRHKDRTTSWGFGKEKLLYLSCPSYPYIHSVVVGFEGPKSC